jgi:hypothetical protein
VSGELDLRPCQGLLAVPDGFAQRMRSAPAFEQARGDSRRHDQGAGKREHHPGFASHDGDRGGARRGEDPFEDPILLVDIGA